MSAEPPRDPPPLPPFEPARKHEHEREHEHEHEREAARAFEVAARLAGPTPLSNALVVAISAVHLALFWESFEAQGRPFASEDLLLTVPGEELVRRGAMIPVLVKAGEAWRLLASPFLHVNLLHLVIDAMFVRSLCRPAEQLLGKAPLGLGLFLGSLGAAAWSASGGRMALGAAGAACGAAGLLVTGLRGAGLPAGFAGSVRARILMNIGIFVLLSLAINAAMGAAGVPIALGNDVLLGGLAGGLVAGLIVAPPLVPRVRLSPLRRFVERGAMISTLTAALLFGLTGGPRLLGLGGFGRGPGGPGAFHGPGGPGDDARAHLVPGLAGPLKEVRLDALGVTLSVPESWLELKRTKTAAHWGPMRGAPFLQLQLIRRPEGAFMPDYGDADTVVAEVVRELEKEGAQDIAAAPYERVRAGGLQATRVDLRYRIHGQSLQHVMILARGGAAVYFLAFLGVEGAAGAMEARLLGAVRFAESP